MQSPVPSDAELLADWLGHQHEPAFHALVGRYAGLVHGAAKRTCADETLATEASQLTFILLARKAKSLASRSTLAGWLHLTAVMQAKNLARSNQREHRKRQNFAMETASQDHPGGAWEEMQPVLDDALAALSDKDREALLLRFYRSLSVREVAATLGIATDAAQKRIDRATERLRGKLARRGCQAGGSLLGVLLAGFAADAHAAVLPVSMLASKAIAAATVSTGIFTSAIITLTSVMKSTSLIVPAVALISSAALIATQHHSISNLIQESSTLQKAIAARSSIGTADSRSAATPSVTKAAEGKEPLDWEKIAGQLAEMESRSGMISMRDGMKLQQLEQRIQAMSKEERVTALNEIAALDLPGKSRMDLENMLVGPLVQQDPEFALTKCIDRIHDSDGPMGWQLANAMREWTLKDPASAITWVDQQIAAGKFDSKSLDGKSRPRLQFEGNLINLLLGSDPDAAGRRLAALPENQRSEALSQSAQRLKEEDQAAFAKLVRDHLPEKDQAQRLGEKASSLVYMGGYSKVTEFLDRIQATPSERISCVEQTAISWLKDIPFKEKVTRQDIDKMREWVTAQAPESIAAVTGQALANAAQNGRKMEFSVAANLALEYATAAGDDAVLSSFLDSPSAQQNKEQARVLAEKILDPNRREEILNKLK